MKKINVRGPGKLKEVMARKVRYGAGFLYITLPKAYCELHNIKKGDSMAMIFGESLRITPVKKGE